MQIFIVWCHLKGSQYILRKLHGGTDSLKDSTVTRFTNTWLSFPKFTNRGWIVKAIPPPLSIISHYKGTKKNDTSNKFRLLLLWRSFKQVKNELQKSAELNWKAVSSTSLNYNWDNADYEEVGGENNIWINDLVLSEK